MKDRRGPFRKDMVAVLPAVLLVGVILGILVATSALSASARGFAQPAWSLEDRRELLAADLAGVPPLTDFACPNYSPTFPSLGGPDCTFPCSSGSRTGGAAFLDVFPESYTKKIHDAGDLVRSIDENNTIYLDGRGGRVGSHVSFSYYCCHPEEELQRIRALVLEDWKSWWQPERLNLSYVTCAMDGPALDHVSFIVMLDEPSNRLMLSWVLAVEARIRAAGLPVHLSRLLQEPFHTTLGVVNGSGYPVRRAIEAINAQFPPGSWLRDPLRQGNLTFFSNPAGPA